MAMPTCTKIAPRSDPRRWADRMTSSAILLGSCRLFLFAGSLPRRRVDHPRAAFDLLAHTAASRRTQETLRQGRQRRNLVGIERPHQAWSDQHHQLGALGLIGF